MMDADFSMRNYHVQEPIGNYLYVPPLPLTSAVND